MSRRRRRDCDFDQMPPPPAGPPETSSDPLVHAAIVTEVLHCHNCSKRFSARVDYRINGNHILLCSYCGHEHCRVVKDGRVTGDRWEKRNDTVTVVGSRWTPESRPLATNTVFEHVRQAWLRLGEEDALHEVRG